MDGKIDIVLPWVDGNDANWLNDYNKYAVQDTGNDTRTIRFRDWELLRFWFRSIEKFATWVNQIHFVTAGDIPDWLNTNHPKLNWVKHADFIPEEYLPTFNANTIELNIHRIESLSEHFIYFNDDLFLLRELPVSRFFNKGLPCDYAVMTAKPSGGGIIHIAINDLEVLNSAFDKHTQIKKYPTKWFTPKYGKGIINNILLLSWKDFSGFIDPHLSNSFLKSTFVEVWQKHPDILDKTCQSRFRSDKDVNQWLMRYWQLAKGSFASYNTVRNSKNTDISDTTLPHICKAIRSQEYDMICINDSENISDFDKTKALIKESFEKILPEKSSFEIF